MKKLICDLCGEETDNLHDIEVVTKVIQKQEWHTYEETKMQVCPQCVYKYNFESRKALERIYKKLKKVK